MLRIVVIGLVLNFTLFSPDLAAEPAKDGLAEAKGKPETPKRTVVLICFTGGDSTLKKACDAMKRRMQPQKGDAKTCEPAIDVLELKTDPSLADIREALEKKDLPKNAVVMISGHAIQLPPRKSGETDKEWDERISKGSREKKEHHLARGVNLGERTDDILAELNRIMETPSVWVSSCKAGMVCSSRYCVGGSCQKDELTRSDDRTDFVDHPTGELLELLCDEKLFKKADAMNDDKAMDGKISSEELSRYFCENPRYRKFHEWSLKKGESYSDNKKAKEDWVRRQYEYEYKADLSDATPEERARVELMKKTYPTVEALLKKIEWLEEDDLYNTYTVNRDKKDSKTGEPLRNYLYTTLRATVPVPNARACVRYSTDSSIVTYHPHLSNFSLFFSPSLPTKAKPKETKPKDSSGKGKSH